MAAKPQCFAYNRSGSRCNKAAGHTGDHAVNLTWTDDECFTPKAAITASPYGTTTIGSGTLGTTEVKVTEHGFEVKKSSPKPPNDEACVACGHRHRAGECKCGCHSHVG